MSVASMAAITLNCADVEALANFWAELLGGEIVYRSEQVIALGTPRGALLCAQVPDYQPPTWPQGERPTQLHLDLAVADRDAARDEALRLGATVAQHQPGGDTWLVLLDPAGHPFCLTSMPPGWPPLPLSTAD